MSVSSNQVKNQIKSNDLTIKLAKIILDFCKETTYSFEKNVYSNAKANVKKQGLNNIQCTNLVKYFNSAYKMLATQTDEYFFKKFNEMQEVIPHSYICLLNITFLISSTIAQSINRLELDDISYEKYMESIETQVNKICTTMNVEKLILHSCNIQNSNLDPNIELFYVQKEK